jgi:RimJ/RimL family protein N-acetyltransferase
MNSLIIEPVSGDKDLLAFIKLPFRIYKGDPYWVPPLISERKDFLNPEKNPFFEHADVTLFLARRDGEVVGTIAALIDHNHNDFHEERAGSFGFFEAIEDYSVAEALLSTACDWVKERDMEVIRGPLNFSQNQECGLLVDGFDESPVIMMTYNPRYYIDFIERFGFVKAHDLYAYIAERKDFSAVDELPPKLLRVAEKAKEKRRIKFRKVDMANFERELEMAKEVYNKAWERNWGFVPMTDAEFDHLAANLKPLLDPSLVFVAEADGEPVGVSIALPDLHKPLKHMGGRMFPFGWLKFLWYRRKIDTARLLILGVVEEYRGSGIDALFYLELGREMLKTKRWQRLECSWVLESNEPMCRILERIGTRRYKTYRIYEKSLVD